MRPTERRRIVWILVFTVILSLGVASIAGADVEDTTRLQKSLVELRNLTCAGFIADTRSIIPRYHKEGKFDSIASLIDSVDAHCSFRPLLSYRLLRQIQTGTLDPHWCDSMLVNEMLYGYTYKAGHYYYVQRWYLDPPGEYALFIDSLATDLAKNLRPSSFEHAVATFYAYGRDSVWARLAEHAYVGRYVRAGRV